MNKKMLAWVIMACLSLSVQAQIAKWLVRPNYDFIEMMDYGLLKVASNGKIGLLNKEGKEILPLEFDSITAFKEERALLFKYGKLYGITDPYGQIFSIEGKEYKLPDGVNRFYSGLLLVRQNNQYFYLNTEGIQVFGPFAEAYPFFDGHALVKSYADYPKNPNETYCDFINTEGIPFVLQDEDKKDISFMSSFHNGRAIIAIKKKFYTIDSKTYELTPISIDSTFNKKSLVVSPAKEIPIIKGDEGYLVGAKNGKFIFDQFMRLKYMELLGNEPVISEFPLESERTYTSVFKKLSKDNRYGLVFKGKELLPPQFDEILHLEDDLAIVKSDGKCGVITVDSDNNFLFKLNNNENIGFNHQYYDAKLTTLMPPYIKCTSATVASHSEDCEIQIESRTENENVEGNTLTYNCRLSIPKDLTDTLTAHDYFYSLRYDGLLSVPHKVTISEWYVKYYEVNLSNTNFSISSANDTISVEFDLIKTDVARNDESNYFKNVEVVASNFSEQPILNKITENHYIFQLFGIDQERINFSVRITEIGCPTIEYPFEMVFVKPKPRERNKKTTVTITPIQKKTTPVAKEIILLD